MSEAPQKSDKKKRASKRYPYQRAGRSEIDGSGHEIQLLNISTTGLQFAARNRIETKDPICIKWSDSKFGAFDPTFLIVREIHQPENKEYQYFYGAQYCTLSNEMKEKLLQLLKSFKEEASNEIMAGDEQITPGYLFKIIEQGPAFLKQLITQKSESHYFRPMLVDIPEYEKNAFEAKDENSKWIEQLATHHFHCNILISLVPVIAQSVQQIAMFLNVVYQEIKKINQTENHLEEALKKIMASGLNDENRKNLQVHFNESSNRLFYSKQSLLQNVVQTFGERVFDETEKGTFEKLNQAYETMISITASVQEGAVVYSRKTKKPDEFSKVEFIADVPAFEEKKPNYFMFFMGFILIVILTGVGFAYYDQAHQKKSLAQSIGIEIEILKSERIGTQLDMIFSEAEWKRLPKEVEKNIFEKISIYLSAQKNLRSIVILDDASHIILVMDKNKPLHKIE
jgi:PAS domain-containing protein